MSKARTIADIGSNDVLETTSTGVEVSGTLTASAANVTGTIAADAANIAGAITADGLTVDGLIRTVGGGSAGAVAIGVGDNDSGLYRSAFNEVRISAGGKGVAGFFNSGDITFYESTGTTPKFFWDASAESLGIGTSSPSSTLDVTGTVTSTKLEVTSGTPVIDFIDTGAANIESRINGESRKLTYISDLAGVGGGEHIFKNGTTEAMRIDSDGNVGIGINSPGAKLDVGSPSDASINMSASADGHFKVSGGGYSFAVANNDTGTYLYNNGSSRAMVFGVNETERMRIDSNGTLIHKGAAVFNEDGGNSDFRVGSDTQTHMLFVDADENAVGINNNSPTWPLHLNATASLGQTANDYQKLARFYGYNGNLSYLDIFQLRETDGSDWATAATRIQQSIDSVEQAYLQFNGDGNLYGVSIGTGGGTVGYQEADENIRFNTGGIVVNEGGLDRDFRVESDNDSAALFVQGDNGKVGVGSGTSLTYDLQIKSGTSTASMRQGAWSTWNFALNIPSSETRWYKLTSYSSATGNMILAGTLDMQFHRNGGGQQTSGFKTQTCHYAQYSGSMIKTYLNDVTSAGYKNATIFLGTDNCLYLQVNSTVYGGTVHCSLRGFAYGFQADDNNYVTTSP
jgi:hypothetical protein